MSLASTRRGHRRHALAAAAAATLLGLAPSAFALSYSWSGGDFVAGSTAPSPLAAADVLTINAGSNKTFNGPGGNFSNSGTVNWNADTLLLANGAAVVNNGLWNANGDFALVYNGGSGPSFSNNGTLRKTVGTGALTINNAVGFVNSGTLDAQAGSITFVGGSSFNAGSVFTGAGSVQMSAGTNTFNGAFTSANLQLVAGEHRGNNAVLNGTVRWLGGSISGGWQVASGQTLTALAGLNGSNKALDGTAALLDNRGNLAWSSGDALLLQNGATLRNTGTFTAGQSMAILYSGGSGPAVQNNSGGTLRAAAGATLTVGDVGFVNNAGTLDALAGGSIRYAGGATFNAGTSFTGAGRNVAAGNNSFAGSFTSANLVLDSGVHRGNGAVLGGLVSWTGGSLDGSWNVAAGQTLRGDSGSNKAVDGSAAVLTNNGTLRWTTGDSLLLQNGASVVNQGLFVADTGMAVLYNGGAGPSFNNTASGTVRAGAGSTLTIGGSTGFVNNGGVLDAQAGGSIVYTGARFNAGTQFSGAGSNSTVGDNTFSGSFSSANLVLQSGTQTGSNAVLNGTTRWTGAQLDSSWNVASGQTLRADSGGNKQLDGAATVLTNNGSIDWATSNPLLLQNGAVLVNQGLFLASDSSAITYNGGNGPVFNNTASGVVRAAAGKTLAITTFAGFVNNGGTLDALAGATISFNTAQFNAGSTFSGAGRNVASGNNGFSGALNSANLVLQDGTHSGNAAVLNGNTAFSGGALAGTWRVAAGQTLRGVDGSNKAIDGTATVLTNQGTVAWASANPLLLQNGAVLTNAGTLNFSADGSLLYNGGNQPSVVNTGLIVKSGGSGTSSIGDTLGFSNLGVIDVQAGTIALPGNFSNSGRLQGVGSYSVNGTLANAGTVAPGSAGAGTLRLAGNYAQTAAGSLAVDLTSQATHDLFNITGSAALSGTLAISCFASCSLAVGDVVTILDADGDISGSFASVTLSGFATGAFNVLYDTVADRVQLVVTQAVTAVPEPGSCALWLAGLGALGLVVRRKGGTLQRG